MSSTRNVRLRHPFHLFHNLVIMRIGLRGSNSALRPLNLTQCNPSNEGPVCRNDNPAKYYLGLISIANTQGWSVEARDQSI